MKIVLAAVLFGSMVAGCASKPPKESREHSDRVAPAPATAPTTQAAAQAMSLEDALKLIDGRPDWTDFPPINVPRHPAEKYLRGMVIVIDPGHGGEDGGDSSTKPVGYKEGPTGAKEAHMNLRVSLLLRRLLADAGATVVMTREDDETISLSQRAQVANDMIRPDGQRGADLFISVHHNASGDRVSNYTGVWYHGSIDDNEVELDVGRYVAHALGAELRTDAARTSPLFSSHLMYGTGFGVLRTCKVPAILIESSFFTNPAEEQRLNDAGHNLREAYGIYRALCEYAYGGRPTQSMPAVEMGQGSRVTLVTTLNDGLPNWWGSDRPRILSSTIRVNVNGEAVDHTLDPLKNALRASFDLAGAETIVEIHHQNMFKHSNWPQRYAIRRGTGSEQVTVEPLDPVRGTHKVPATEPVTAATKAATKMSHAPGSVRSSQP